MKTTTGTPFPLGSTPQDKGVNFALYSRHAEAVELCLFDEQDNETSRIPVIHRLHGVWHVFVEGVEAGQRYGYRLHGRYHPEQGERFNPYKVMLDPYAQRIEGEVNWNGALYDFCLDGELILMDHQDNAKDVPKSVVAEPDVFDWQGITRPTTPPSSSIIYEAHVKGFTMQHPEIPEALRGTYLGMGHPVAIDYLKSLGITAVELLPVHYFLDEPRLNELGLVNYWGYNSLNFFTPTPRYAVEDPVSEFKTLVRELHRAGIEVILDVVYNHTCEGGYQGPSFCYKGIDNESYYLLNSKNKSDYPNHSGCGNTINAENSQVLKLIMDSLRHWVTTYQVDGFRFDLAPALAREYGFFSTSSAFFDIIHQDPVLSQVKMIAEPWDMGPDGYQLGNFPNGWSEWNDRYREHIRQFWRGDNDTLREFSSLVYGSSKVYQPRKRHASASINYICSHDGFTLNDLVSYTERHNEANHENNRDGDANNNSWNCGIEGPTDDPDIMQKREQSKRNLLITLLLSKGIPMLLAGDEFANSQSGNNNAYCQDSPIAWLDWSWLTDDTPAAKNARILHSFVTQLIDLRKHHGLLNEDRYLRVLEDGSQAMPDIEWLTETFTPMQPIYWHEQDRTWIAVKLLGERLPEPEDNLIFLINAAAEDITFDTGGAHRVWTQILDSACQESCFNQQDTEATSLRVKASSIMLFKEPKLTS